jgi:S1-C subfamily serine protease
VNTLDLIVFAAALFAAIGGYRMGFLTAVPSWLGLMLGFLAGALVVEPILDHLQEATDVQVALVVVGTLACTSFIGNGIGLLIGRTMQVALPLGPARRADRAAGGVAGFVGAFAAFWFLLPLLGDVHGWMSYETRTSTMADVVSDHLPDPPFSLELRRFLNNAGIPRVFDALEPAPDVGAPPTASTLSQAVVDRVIPSTVKVQGVACRRIQEGSGWVLADGLVVTNAHVVAGERTTVLQRSDLSEVDATVVAFDPSRDLAILRAPGLHRDPLPRSTASVGDVGASFGHPGGGALRAAPYQVGRKVVATGTDIYDSASTRRDVLVLAADLHPGDSGGALVNPKGEVVGVAFAIAPDKAGVAYALAMSELDAVIGGDLTHAVDTGPCLRD